MRTRSRIVALAVAVPAALGLPGVANAHTVAPAPVATDFHARLVAIRPPLDGLDAKVVDGDRLLWLRAPADATIVVPGAIGEPLLRFDRQGVFVNLRSPTAQADRIDRFDLDPSTEPGAAPRWHRLTPGHVYAWHEHRLHALEPLAHERHTSGVLGAWTVPLRVDGRQVALRGVLDYQRPGSIWPWLGVAAALGGLALAAGRAPARRRPAALASAAATVVLVWVARVGRELYGRPTVGATGYLSLAGTCVVGAALLWGLTRRDPGVRTFTGLLAGAGAVYQALTMLPILWHATALTLLPSTAAKAALAGLIGLGTAAFALAAADHLARAGDVAADARLVEAA